MAATDSDGSRPDAVVVEEDDGSRRVVVGYLEQEGFVVAQAANMHTAVDLARSGMPDVIVLFPGLPRIDGIEVCRQVRAFTDANIIMLTARSDVVDKLIGRSVGADDCLTKPFSPSELMAGIKVMLCRPRPQSTASRFAAKGVAVTRPTVPGPLAVVDPDRIVEIIFQRQEYALRACDTSRSVTIDNRNIGSRARLTVTGRPPALSSPSIYHAPKGWAVGRGRGARTVTTPDCNLHQSARMVCRMVGTGRDDRHRRLGGRPRTADPWAEDER